MLERFYDGEVLLAIIIRASHESVPGTMFFTHPTEGLQAATMHHPLGYLVIPHTHIAYPRTVYKTQEVIFIRSGTMDITFYDLNRNQLTTSRCLVQGDIVILLDGGHSFELKNGPCDFFEVKQGPYDKRKDKIRFSITGSCPCGCGSVDCCLGG